MQPLTHERLAASAYRTLGLSGSASQAAIDAAMRRLRLWPDSARVPSTPWDFPWLGALARSRNDIERAGARLADPVTRLEEQLLWYLSDDPPATSIAQFRKWVAQSREVSSALERHDLAVGAIYLALLEAASAIDRKLWGGAIAGLCQEPESRVLADWLLRAQRDGGFDKRATSDEIERALRSMPDRLAATLLAGAQTALQDNDDNAWETILGLFSELRPLQQNTAVLDELVDRLEDAIALCCRKMESDLRGKLLTHHDAPEQDYSRNLEASRAAERYYAGSVAPNLRRFRKLAANDSSRFLRVTSQCAAVLDLLGLGWEWAGKFKKAQATLATALKLGVGSGTEAVIRLSMERVRLRARQPRRKHATSSTTRGRFWPSWQAWVAGSLIFGSFLIFVAWLGQEKKPATSNEVHEDLMQSVRSLSQATTRPAGPIEPLWQSTGETNREP